MATALNYITTAMKKAGILSDVETPTASQASDALETMNDLLDSWSNEGLLTSARTLEEFTFSGGVANYTMGAGGDFDTSKPVQLVSIYTRRGTTDYAIRELSDDRYADIISKDTLGIPDYVNFTNAFPLSLLKFYPVPSNSDPVFILSDKEIGNYSLSDTISLPLGWARAIKYNLAIELATEYGVSAPQETVATANDALIKIKLAIAKNRQIDATPQSVGNDNIFTGWND